MHFLYSLSFPINVNGLHFYQPCVYIMRDYAKQGRLLPVILEIDAGSVLSSCITEWNALILRMKISCTRPGLTCAQE